MKKTAIRFAIIGIMILICYGIGRLYYHVTAGFTIGNITSDFAYQPQWEVRPLASDEHVVLEEALRQPYHYLGKGCQSYVFSSEDNKYVVKFFKYQRYRLLSWLTYFPPLPAIVKYREQKMGKKWSKLDGFVQSWKLAFENLKEETGLVFVHLNKTDHLNKQLTIYDKIGMKHIVNLDQMEFCIQKKAKMLCDVLMECQRNGDFPRAQQIVQNLLGMVLSEYARGIADNDHALMQNTGVSEGKPVHIDVGQFVFNDEVKNQEVFHQELITKTYKFKLWLRKQYPELADDLESQLYQIVGPHYDTIKPKFRVR
jgi:hypothetical protein